MHQTPAPLGRLDSARAVRKARPHFISIVFLPQRNCTHVSHVSTDMKAPTSGYRPMTVFVCFAFLTTCRTKKMPTLDCDCDCEGSVHEKKIPTPRFLLFFSRPSQGGYVLLIEPCKIKVAE